ncbi:MAG: arsenate reductase ArsC [Alphaproteobacteria bacterium]|nr:MAG: arsenate reductase ArsC [Alphaproteobacteria bacterium]
MKSRQDGHNQKEGAMASPDPGCGAGQTKNGESMAMTREGESRRWHVLYLCTGNSARSILAEAWTRHAHGDRFLAMSAGSDPVGAVNRFALRCLEEEGVATEGLESKGLDRFLGPNAPRIDLAVTVCDHAARNCPVFPGAPIRLHWPLPDPARIEPGEAMAMAAFRETLAVLKERIAALAEQAAAAGTIDALKTRLAADPRAFLHPVG